MIELRFHTYRSDLKGSATCKHKYIHISSLSLPYPLISLSLTTIAGMVKRKDKFKKWSLFRDQKNNRYKRLKNIWTLWSTFFPTIGFWLQIQYCKVKEEKKYKFQNIQTWNWEKSEQPKCLIITKLLNIYL